MKIPFDIKYRPQIESGEYKVETRDGRPARIVCWDRQSKDHPLIVLISYGTCEACVVYATDGRYPMNDQGTSAYDLIIITTELGVKESEDERIRENLHNFFLNAKLRKQNLGVGVSNEKILAYLEKQKVQPTDTKTEQVIKAARRVLNNWLDDTACPDVSGDFAELEYAIREYDGEEEQKVQKGSLRVIKDASEWENIKEQNPAEWSEEDEKMLEAIVGDIHCGADFSAEVIHEANKREKWLRALRPQPHWKPSEEQLSRLQFAMNLLEEKCEYVPEILWGLYNQLKKLM